MNTQEAKEYATQRYYEILADNPTWNRIEVTNLIIRELKTDHNFTLTTPFNNPIVGVSEDAVGIIYHV